jgi:signal peptidase I
VTWLVIAAVTVAPMPGLLVFWARRRLLLVTIDGASMEPALRNGDRVLVYRPRRFSPRRNQVIVLEPLRDMASVEDEDPPLSERRLMAKRVAAIAGESWPSLMAERGHETVPSGTVVVLGDNTDHSFDSRHYGAVSVDRVLGVVAFRLNGRDAVVGD